MEKKGTAVKIRAGSQRVVRIIRGCARPASRRRYLAAARRRLLGAAPPKSGARSQGFASAVTQPRRQCLVCGGERLRRRTIRYFKNKSLVCNVRRCRDCGYVRIPRGQGKYRAMTSMDELQPGTSTRVGSMERQGREFHLAKMAMGMVGRENLDVLVYGAGGSMDNHHINALPAARRVAIGDIMKVRTDAEFIDITKPATQQFDVVIASEVVEHFRKPRKDFARLLSFVRDDGLLVCGTNINRGGDLARHRYIFYPDHTSYYSPESLRLIANAMGWHFDFRSPSIGMKRYVMFSRSQEVMENVACYFGRDVFAPSEHNPARTPR